MSYSLALPSSPISPGFSFFNLISTTLLFPPPFSALLTQDIVNDLHSISRRLFVIWHLPPLSFFRFHATLSQCSFSTHLPLLSLQSLVFFVCNSVESVLRHFHFPRSLFSCRPGLCHDITPTFNVQYADPPHSAPATPHPTIVPTPPSFPTLHSSGLRAHILLFTHLLSLLDLCTRHPLLGYIPQS
jgi:hypothetical protein